MLDFHGLLKRGDVSLLVGVQQTNEKAALSSQKTVNKQDEVIGNTARPDDDDGAPHWITVDSASTSTSLLPLIPLLSDAFFPLIDQYRKYSTVYALTYLQRRWFLLCCTGEELSDPHN